MSSSNLKVTAESTMRMSKLLKWRSKSKTKHSLGLGLKLVLKWPKTVDEA